MLEVVQHDEPDGDVEQTETNYRQTHHGTRTEGNLQTCIEALTSSISGTSAGVCSGLHAEEASQAREETTSEECERHPWVLHVKHIGHESEECCQSDEHVEHYFVLLFEVSHSTVAHVLSDFTHARSAFVGFDHTLEEEPGHAQSYDRGYGHQPEYSWNVVHKI